MQEQFQLARAIASTSWGVVVTDPHQPNYPIVFVNPAFTQITGYSAAEIIGKNCRILQGSETDPATVQQIRQAIAAQQPVTCTILNYRQDGVPFWNELTLDPIFDDQGNLAQYVGIQRDVTAQKRTAEQKQVEERLLYEVLYDALTGLPNRVLLLERLRHMVQAAQRGREALFGLLFIDLDRFKVINDSLGQMLGDRLLIAIAERLASCLRPSDTLARLGGDEFVILLEDTKTADVATQIADRIQQELAQPFRVEAHEIFTAASIGIALSTIAYDRPEDLLRDANIAMHRAKDQGRARYEIFHPMMYTNAVALLQLETDLRRAIERNEIELHYQPIISLRNQRISGFEALLRWRHPTRGWISPVEFVPIAEQTGLIVPIGAWVLREACRQMQTWQSQFGSDRLLTVNVNLSGKQFSPELAPQISQVLQETGLNPCQLKLEITESLLMENAESAIEMLTRLQQLGVQLAIDDFGTGYSSLSYLHRLPIDTLKVDRSFIQRIDSDGEQLAIVRTIIILAWNLGMEVVAEGAETAKQVAQLKALRCEYAQGYFFAKPLDIEAAEQYLIAESKAAAAKAERSNSQLNNQLNGQLND
jgi:diguanylate cyclase (GGDEF)-like protein/PAS domain S-box-containing protein